MIKEEFSIGPFTIRPSGMVNQAQLVDLLYGSEVMRERIIVAPGTRAQVAEQLEEAIGDITRELRNEHESSYRIYLVDGYGESVGASFECETSVVPGMTAGLVDDRYPLWLRSADRLYSMPVTIDEYAAISARESRPDHAWIADLLPDDVLTTDADEWRPPSHWELRHVVGEGGFVGISGAKAAALVGVTPQNFRKYTASESAKNRQSISFAMWHLLLHRLGIQRAPEGWA